MKNDSLSHHHGDTLTHSSFQPFSCSFIAVLGTISLFVRHNCGADGLTFVVYFNILVYKNSLQDWLCDCKVFRSCRNQNYIVLDVSRFRAVLLCPSKQAILVQSFPNFTVIYCNILGFSATSQDIAQPDLWVNLLACRFGGKMNNCVQYFPAVSNLSLDNNWLRIVWRLLLNYFTDRWAAAYDLKKNPCWNIYIWLH